MNLNFGENFKRLRKGKDVTQEKIAEILGVSSQSVSRWELGVCYPDLEFLPTIANYFGVTIDSLLSNDSVAQEQDRKSFEEKLNQIPWGTLEQITFVEEYCRKYPDNDYYAFNLVDAIRGYVVGDEEKTNQYMPILLKNAQRLLETQYRNATIQFMATVCDEKDLESWLKLCPYGYVLNRRSCLVWRSQLHDKTGKQHYVQQGLEMLERFAAQLDSRCPDKLGAKQKANYQKAILNIVASFGDGIEPPDGWKLFYAYKQLVLAACLFGQKQYEEGWAAFDSAMQKYQYIFDLQEEWLDLGGTLFSDLKVGKDWNYAIDTEGNKHKLFGMLGLSFYDAEFLRDFLNDRRWAWFNSVRETPKYQAAIAWAEEKMKEQEA